MARIAFIEVTATVSYGGVQTVAWKLADRLTDLGHTVEVFGGAGTVVPPVRNAIPVHRFPFTPRENVLDLGSRFQRTVERMTFARHARAALVAGNYDWAVMFKPFDFFWPWIMPSRCRTRFAFTSGGTDFVPFDRLLARRIDVMLSCSYFNAWQLRTRYRKHYSVVTYNGVDVEQFAPQSHQSSTIRKRLGVADDVVLFGFAGRLVGWKGMSVAVRAMAEPALRQLPAKLLIIGDGPQRAELRALADRLKVTDRIIFQEPVPHAELPAWYAAIDVGVFPSIGDEAFGITIAEAMSSGKPVIGSHIGGIPEVIGNEGSAGLLVAPRDVPGLAAAMRELALDPARRTRMGAAARARIETNFTWMAAAQRLLKGLGL